jgi:exopolyphosphatase/guanosine-5'-triphosphate,3'-diphosphate pyrophosphatase
MRVAAIDIGTNTVLLLIADVEQDSFQVLRDDHAIARLGEGVDRTHHISEAAYQRLIPILRRHLSMVEALHCDRIDAIATSAMRDAENREEMIARIRRETGIEIELLRGEEEAHWTYRGAVQGMATQNEALAVIDIGGGSTELSIGRGEMFEHGVSVEIGAVRMTERFLTAGKSIEETRLFIRQMLEQVAIPTSGNRRVIAVAGTPTTLAAAEQELPAFDAVKVQGFTLSRNDIERWIEIMSQHSREELLRRYPAINKARADILTAGTLILAEAMEYLGAPDVTVSTQGLRYGIALRATE